MKKFIFLLGEKDVLIFRLGNQFNKLAKEKTEIEEELVTVRRKLEELHGQLARANEHVAVFNRPRLTQGDVDGRSDPVRSTPTNHPLNSIRWNRTTKIFEEWNGTTWVAQVIGIPGGGTGAALPGDIATSLGLGTMSIQNANAVAITGGSIANIASSGAFTHNGSTFSISSATGQAATINSTFSGAWGLAVMGVTHGLIIQAGTANVNDWALLVGNNPTDKWGLRVRGDQVVYCGWRLIIPVGTDMWAVLGGEDSWFALGSKDYA